VAIIIIVFIIIVFIIVELTYGDDGDDNGGNDAKRFLRFPAVVKSLASNRNPNLTASWSQNSVVP